MKRAIFASLLFIALATMMSGRSSTRNNRLTLDQELSGVLRQNGFTGRVEQSLEARLGRRIDQRLADTGNRLFFDTVLGLNDDNSCSGCHSPTNAMGDSQSVAVGIDNNGLVGPNRSGPRNQRRTPSVVNSAFFPRLMWNGRFAALSGDPFDNRGGFSFPQPEGLSLSYLPHLLTSQVFIPPTERVEAAGFHFPGDNYDIRREVLRRVNVVDEYRKRFGHEVQFDDIARAISEFEFGLVFSDAPVDRYARGQQNALTAAQKRGALVFFGEGRCVQCHQVSGQSNEQFSDFQEHVAGVPQIAPINGNVTFDGPNEDEDFGREQLSGNARDRYAFRTSPLRNVSQQAAFFHDGAFVRLDDAIRFHLDAVAGNRNYNARAAGVASDLARLGPSAPVLARLDPLLRTPIKLSDLEVDDLISFVRDGLLDDRAKPSNLKKLIPKSLPSGFNVLTFQF